MSNHTVQGAIRIHGSDPQHLIEKITRERIYASRYWKESCFGLTAESLLDRVLKLQWAGGSFGAHQRPTEFLCLLLKLLQLQPSSAVLEAYLEAEEHKYLRLLIALYYRMTETRSARIYERLEPFLQDFRRIRSRQRDGTFQLRRIDELIWGLLKEEKWFDVMLPRLGRRTILEDLGELPGPRISVIEEEAGAETEVKAKAETEAEEKIKTRGSKPATSVKSGNADSSIDEENALRAKLGLKPLQP